MEERALLLIVLCLAIKTNASGAARHVSGKQQCERIKIPACQGLGYNMTTMPNLMKHVDQQQAQNAMELFDLRLHFNCSPHLRFLLCSMFTPMCSEHVTGPIPACRSHCEQVRNDCEPLVQWPIELECDSFPEPPSVCMQLSDTKDDLAPPPIFQFIPHVKEQEMSCSDQEVSYTEEDIVFAEKWAKGWGWVCFVSTVFTLFTWAVEPTRYKYPARPVVFIALCYSVQGLIYILRGFFGSPSSGMCLTSSILLYYTSLAGSAWWLAFILSWWLSASRDWSSEALTNNLSPRLHLNCWGGPLLVTGGVFLGNVTYGPTLGGPCELQNPLSVLIPHSVLLLSICVLAALTAIAMVRVRRTFRATRRSAGKLERLIPRLAIYIVMYIVPSGGWLVCLAYDKVRPASLSDSVNKDGQLECDRLGLEVSLLKTFLFLMLGIMSGMWVWSSKTCRAWSRILGTAPKKERRLAQPVSRV